MLSEFSGFFFRLLLYKRDTLHYMYLTEQMINQAFIEHRSRYFYCMLNFALHRSNLNY